MVVPPPYSAAEGGGGGGASEAPLELRGSLDCWACSVLVTAQNLVIAAINACLASLVFGSILTPAVVMVTFGFLCHSTVRREGGNGLVSGWEMYLRQNLQQVKRLEIVKLRCEKVQNVCDPTRPQD